MTIGTNNSSKSGGENKLDIFKDIKALFLPLGLEMTPRRLSILLKNFENSGGYIIQQNDDSHTIKADFVVISNRTKYDKYSEYIRKNRWIRKFLNKNILKISPNWIAECLVQRKLIQKDFFEIQFDNGDIFKRPTIKPLTDKKSTFTSNLNKADDSEEAKIFNIEESKEPQKNIIKKNNKTMDSDIIQLREPKIEEEVSFNKNNNIIKTEKNENTINTENNENNKLLDMFIMNADRLDEEEETAKIERNFSLSQNEIKNFDNEEDLKGTVLEGIGNYDKLKIKKMPNDPKEEEKRIKNDEYWDGKRDRFACNYCPDRPNFNKHITSIFERMKKLYELLNDNERATAYRKAINYLKQFPVKVTEARDVRKDSYLKWKMCKKIDEICKTGRLTLLDHLENDPKIKTIEELNSVWGIGPKNALDFYRNGVNCIKDLWKTKLTPNQKIGLKYYGELSQRIPRDEATKIIEIVKNIAYKVVPDGSKILEIIPCGSYRRGKLTIGDIDILITRKDSRVVNGLNNIIVEE